MAYTINKSDGTIVATVPDGQVDTLTTDITLIGKNYSGFGEALNENFIKLLENFASSSRPARPIRGQIWYDTNELKLKVYTGTSFVPVSSATIANTQPSTLGVGDLWFNDADKQLYFFDGTSTILLGPDFSQSQGLSGLRVTTILDKDNQSRVITSLYNNGVLLGIFSKDNFIPKTPITGFSNAGQDKVIIPGFNAGNLSGIKFDVTVTNSEKLNGAAATVFARQDQANIFLEQTVIKNNAGLTVGAGLEGILEVDVGNLIISNSLSNRRLELRLKKSGDPETALNIIASTRQFKIYEGFIDSETSIGGSLIVNGNLTVNGDVTTVNTSTLTVEDKNIELAKIGTPTDTNANRGGISLKGSSDHSIYWVYNDGTPGEEYNQSWNSTENINLRTGKAYYIAGAAVLDATTCYVPSFPNVNQLGPQLSVTADNIKLDVNRISTVDSAVTAITGNIDLELEPKGTGNVVLIGNPLITGLTTTNETLPSQTVETQTVLSSTELSEATNKKYVTNLVRTRSLAFSMDISDGITNTGRASWLNLIAPVNEFEVGVLARILCSSILNSTTTLNINAVTTKVNNIEYSRPLGTGFPIQDFSFGTATIAAPAVSVSRTVKTFWIDPSDPTTWKFKF